MSDGLTMDGNAPQQPLPQQPSMIPMKKRKKEHPAISQALKSFKAVHGKKRK